MKALKTVVSSHNYNFSPENTVFLDRPALSHYSIFHLQQKKSVYPLKHMVSNAPLEFA
jgi:hypothetical protein